MHRQDQSHFKLSDTKNDVQDMRTNILYDLFIREMSSLYLHQFKIAQKWQNISSKNGKI